MPAKEETGKRYGRLTVIERAANMLDAALAERDALRGSLDQAVSAHVICESQKREAEARAERARREAIEECIAAFPAKGPRSAERARARERLRALLAPEAQRPEEP